MTTCPRCGRTIAPEDLKRRALSRKDNKTLVCERCGTAEALIRPHSLS
jgi:predicted RNA-binding Zn-ribbon protein involved in translation (DUF1610 family)